MTKDNTFMVKDLLKDLSKDLCVVVERNSKEFEKNLKELEVYKKAFELACEEINSRECTTLPNPICKVTCEYSEVCLGSTSWYEMLLKKAGEADD